MDISNTLKELCETAGISGYEKNASKFVCDLFAPFCDDIEIDNFGNVIGIKRSANRAAKTVLLDAHIDQIGFIVTEVLDGGFLRFAEVGGVDPRMLLGCEVSILTETPTYGIISCMPPHLLKSGEQNNAVQIKDMLIDTGLLDAKQSIAIGTPIVFAEKVCQLSKGSITGKCMDDRAGIISILHAMEQLKDADLDVNIAVLISVQEETTGVGAGIGTFKICPDYAIAVDVGHAKTPDASGDNVFEYGGGVMIAMGPNTHTKLTKMLVKTARAEQISFQIEVMEGHTGTNAWAMQVAKYGTAQAILSIPLRYMHTPIESIKISDLVSVSDLITKFLISFNGEVRI